MVPQYLQVLIHSQKGCIGVLISRTVFPFHQAFALRMKTMQGV